MSEVDKYKKGDIVICYNTKEEDDPYMQHEEHLIVGKFYKIHGINLFTVHEGQDYVWIEFENEKRIGYPLRYPGCEEYNYSEEGTFKIAYFDRFFANAKEMRKEKLKKLKI